MKIVSFIIPAYNAEKCLENAVDSLAQVASKHDIEVLIVENGSTDQTKDIALKLANQYDFVQLYNSEKGVSAARNLGILKAQGQWISFVDADDLVCCEDMITAISHLSEVDDFVIACYKKGDTIIDTSHEIDSLSKASLDEKRAYLIGNPTKFLAVWAKFIRSDIIKNNDLIFDRKLSVAEDSDFLIAVTKYCKDITFVPYVVYNYSISSPSTVRSFDNTKVKKYISSMEATAVKIKGEPDIIKKAFDGYVLMHLNISMVHETFSPDNKESFFAKVRTFKRVCKVDIYQNAINNTKFKQCKSARMLPILFVKLHLEGLSGLIYMLRARWNAKRK